MSDGDIIKEFLVSLGFTGDNAELAALRDGIAAVSTKVTALGGAVTDITGVMTAGSGQIAAAVEYLRSLVRDSGVTLPRFGHAAEPMGGAADTAKSLVEQIRELSLGRQLATGGQMGVDPAPMRAIGTTTNGMDRALSPMPPVTDHHNQRQEQPSRAPQDGSASRPLVTGLQDDIRRLCNEVGAFFGKTTEIRPDLRAPMGSFDTTPARDIQAGAGIGEWFGELNTEARKLIQGIMGMRAAGHPSPVEFPAPPDWAEGGQGHANGPPGTETANGGGKPVPATPGAVPGSTAAPPVSALLTTLSAPLASLLGLSRDFAGAWSMAGSALNDANTRLQEFLKTAKTVGHAIGGLVSGDAEPFTGERTARPGSAATGLGLLVPQLVLAPPALAMLMPAPAALATAGAAVTSPLHPDVTIKQQTTIQVLGTDAPDAVARHVAGAQDRVNGDLVRNMKAAVR